MIAELLSSALGLALYLNTLRADFCYDDSRAIKTNQDLLPETPWTHIFYNDFWGTLLTHSGSHKSYRPLCTLSFRINHAVGGMDPWGYHLVNVLLHAAVTGLFTNFSRILFGDGYWTLIAGLLFASHPIHTEAVAGIVGRADIGACLFFLLSLMCYVKHCSTRGSSLSTWGWILGAGLCAGCSMLWKEQGVTVLAISAVYDIFVFHRLKMRQIVPALYKRKNLTLFFSIGLLTSWGTALLGVRLYWMGNKPPSFSNSDNPAADSDSFLTRTLTFFYLPTKNLWLLLCPDTLSFDWSMDAVPLLKAVSDWRNLHTVAFYAGLLLLAYFSLKGSSNERECNGRTVMNGKQNANGHSCHLETEYKTLEVKSSFASKEENAWGNLGNVLKSQSKISEAESAYRNALYYRSNMADMLYNLGLLLQENSRFSEALHYYKLAIGSRPTLASAYLNTGIILMNQGKTEEARRTFLKCSEIPDENLKDPHAHKSSVTSCLYNLGKLFHEQGHYEDALTVYKEAIQKMPRQFAPQSLYNMMGEAYMRMSRLPEAERWYVESLRSKSDHIPAHLTYGKLLALTVS
ncbi:protein O-mannosyl-transferase TMTC2 isoform X2 [Rissa tridactyla]|uniref:protein O-mannosyl-transferase TMTC2 isoform X2 n=1 Tax=Rissa tridactyla TaxID=75485 RepID=UPI0023BAAC6B|nr:protein O-mannosyl-transferase TMTC2 isoform X2 [Rissa tridactyla]